MSSFGSRLKEYFILPNLRFNTTDPDAKISAGLRRRRPVLISWFLLSCVAGALADARRRLERARAAGERKVRLLEELIRDERDGRPADDDEVRHRLRSVGLIKREEVELWERERAEAAAQAQAHRAKLGFWKRYFGSDEEVDEAAESAQHVAEVAALSAAFATPSPPGAPSPASTGSSPAPEAAPQQTTRAFEPVKSVPFVPPEQRAEWAKRSFM